jgi:hemolysin activation/secretion protein
VLLILWGAPLCFATPYPDAAQVYRGYRDKSFVRPGKFVEEIHDGTSAEESSLLDAQGEVVLVTRFVVHGNSQLSEATLGATLEPFINRELPISEITGAATALMNTYRSHGLFTARVYAPTQEIHDGTVVLHVYEGSLEEGGIIVKNSEDMVKTSVVEGILHNALTEGALIEKDQFERGMLLVNDIPGISSYATLYPGTKVGEARFQLSVVDEPTISGNIDFDNFGGWFTGEERIGTTLYINSPTDAGDQLTFRYVTSGEDSNYGYVQYNRPLADNGLRGGISYDYLDYQLGKQFRQFDSAGDAAELRGFITYPFLRGRHTNLIGTVSVSHMTLDDHDNVGLLAKREINSVIFSMSGDHDDDFLVNGNWNFGVDVTVGSNNILANDDYKNFDDQNIGSEGGFFKVNYEVSRLQHLFANLGTLIGVSGQWTTDNLDTSQKFFVGGPFSVAGYPSGETSGDNGAALHADLRYDFYEMPWGGDFQLSVFYAMAWTELHDDTWPGWEGGNPIVENNSVLKSAGIGVSQTWDDSLVLRAMWGHQIGENVNRNPITGDDSDESSSNDRFWVQSILYF